MLKRLSALMLVLLIAMAAFSCEDEEETEDTTLTGVWECKGYTDADGQFLNYPAAGGKGMIVEFLAETYREYITITSGESLYIQYCSTSSTFEYDYTVTNDIITYTDENGDTISGSYSIDGNAMTWNDDNVIYKYEKVDNSVLDDAVESCKK